MAAMAEAPQPQHMTALRVANQNRLARAEIKRKIANGDVAVSEILADTPQAVATMTVMDLLMCQHRWGRHRARRFLVGISMSEDKRIGTLTDRQQKALIARLGGQTVDPFWVFA